VRGQQPWIIRATHWINVVSITSMAMSGLQIFVAYPHFGPSASQWHLPFDGWTPPEVLRSGHGLAAARGIHFLVMWWLIATGVVYLVYTFASGEYRRRFFWPPRDTKPMILQLLYYLRLRKQEPAADLYNGLQRQAYTTAILLGALEVWSGLVMYKPVLLHWLGVPLGGYDGARVVHFFGLVAVATFVVGHVVMVALHPKTFLPMVTGGKSDE
jgi:thiosulfate reductase cytochrome b subunit